MEENHGYEEEVSSERARYMLAETKLKLLNALASLEILERRLVQHRVASQKHEPHAIAANSKPVE